MSRNRNRRRENESNQTKSRKWLVDAGPDLIAADDAAGLLSEVHQVIGLLSRCGGAVKIATEDGNLVIGAARERDEELPGFFVNQYFVFEWFPSMPQARKVEPEPEPPLAHEEPEEDEAETGVLEPVES